MTVDTFPAESNEAAEAKLRLYLHSLSTGQVLGGKPGHDCPQQFPILFLLVPILTFSAKRSEHKALMMPPYRICLGLIAKWANCFLI